MSSEQASKYRDVGQAPFNEEVGTRAEGYPYIVVGETTCQLFIHICAVDKEKTMGGEQRAEPLEGLVDGERKGCVPACNFFPAFQKVNAQPW